ncbi:hypothetical protein DUI87_06092 [Hirundo rustica rustica]|uniref:Uncharacterized protein n=1 Tax=Hirundo rustica rustica TaxID=333673 RepID=A0A3M0KU59_HIRRU|nr:hypothetical protein DUI87_06092 [Hirundo rustica rustica]
MNGTERGRFVDRNSDNREQLLPLGSDVGLYLIILSPKKHKMCRFQPAFHYSNQFIKYTWSKAFYPSAFPIDSVASSHGGYHLLSSRDILQEVPGGDSVAS